MKTRAQVKSEKIDKYLREMTLSTANHIHSLLPGLGGDIIKEGGFYNIPYADIGELALMDNVEGYLREGKGFFVTLNETPNKNIVYSNLAKIVLSEFRLYRSIVDIMRKDIELVSKTVNEMNNKDYKIPEIVLTKMNPFAEDFIGTYSDEILEVSKKAYSAKPLFESKTTIASLGLNAGNIIDFLAGGDRLDSPASNDFIENISPVKALSTVHYMLSKDSLNGDILTIDEMLIYVLFAQALINRNEDEFSIESVKRSLTLCYRTITTFKDTKNLIMDFREDRDEIVCHINHYKAFVKEYSNDVILGHSLESFGSATAEKLIANHQTHLKFLENHKTNMEIKFQKQTAIRTRKLLKDLGNNFLGHMDERLRLRMNPAIATSNNLGSDFMQFANTLSPSTIEDAEELIEAIYMGLIFKDTDFARFYRRIEAISGDNLNSAISQSLYYMVIQLILKEV